MHGHQIRSQLLLLRERERERVCVWVCVLWMKNVSNFL